MKTKMFEDINVIQAANGVVVREAHRSGDYVTSSSRMHVFNDFEEFAEWLRAYIVDTEEKQP